MEKKTCTICNLEKDIDKFHRDKSMRDGHRSACAECKNKRDRKPAEKQWAWLDAADELIKIHERQFNTLLYSAMVRRGLLEINHARTRAA